MPHRKKLYSAIIFFCLLIFTFSCNFKPIEEEKQPDTKELREVLQRTNTMLIDAEQQEIEDFIARYGWKMTETGSGLKYMIYERGNGPKAEKDKIAFIKYSIRLITGDLVYSSDEDGMKSFMIGKGGVESGLEEGILLLRIGDKARFILPSHLAHGVPGDGIKIPRRATIIYDLELIDLK